MEKKPTKKNIYKQHAPILIDTSPSDNSEENYEESFEENYDQQSNLSSKKKKKTINKIQSITDVEYVGDLNNTFTKTLSQTEIKELLNGYKRVEHDELQKGFNIRYFIKDKKTNEMLFRTGGMITYIDNDKKYIVVSGAKSFSVQLKPTTVFYQAMSISDIVRNIKEKHEITESVLNDQIQTLEKENEILMKHNKLMMKDITNKNKQIAKLEETIKKLQKNNKK